MGERYAIRGLASRFLLTRQLDEAARFVAAPGDRVLVLLRPFDTSAASWFWSSLLPGIEP